MFIMDGATILILIHTLHSDTAEYEDPTTYNPERFLGDSKLAPDYATSADYRGKDHYGYGQDDVSVQACIWLSEHNGASLLLYCGHFRFVLIAS
jgi:cytochrome P450